MNVKHFENVMKVILEEPRRANMYVYRITNIKSLDDLDKEGLFAHQKPTDIPACGTIGCIAEWAHMLKEDGSLEDSSRGLSLIGGAKLKLDISSNQAGRLFFSAVWPYKFRVTLATTKPGTQAHAEVIVARMRHMLATGE
jgi:hypothetical protein